MQSTTHARGLGLGLALGFGVVLTVGACQATPRTASACAEDRSTPTVGPSGSPSAPTVSSSDGPVPTINFTNPYCFAYSAALRAFACVHMQAEPHDDGPHDLTSPAMAESIAHAERLGASIEFAVEQIVVGRPDPYNFDMRLRGDVPRVAAALHALGYIEPLPLRADLSATPNGWVELGDFALRYSTEFIERDASVSWNSQLDLRCGAEGPIVDAIPETEPEGAFAVVACTADGSDCALTVELHDGGEGYIYLERNSYAFSPAELCATAG